MLTAAHNQRSRWRRERRVLRGLAALVIAVAVLGCSHERCDDKGDAALQATLPHLTPDIVSNLVREATHCIADALTEPVVQEFYRPTLDQAPVAYSLRVEPPSQFSVGMGATVDVRTRGTSAPYMAVRVPLHVGPGLCLWEVYICVKPGGGFAATNPGWVITEGSTKPAPVVKHSDEIFLYAQQRNM